MRVAAITDNEDLGRFLKDSTVYDASIIHSYSDVDLSKYACFIFDQSKVELFHIMSIRERFESMKIIMLKKDKILEDEKVYIAHDVKIIPYHSSFSDFNQYIDSLLLEHHHEERFSNVIAISGTHSQVGVTQTALSIANAINDNDKNVCVIGLNPYNSGVLSTLEPTDSLDQAYGLIKNDILNEKKFISMFKDVNGVKYLIGNEDVVKIIEFEIEPIEKLIDLASKTFEIVILDLGAFYDNPLPLTGLKLSNMHLLVSSQQELSPKLFKKWFKKVLEPLNLLPSESYLLVNKYRDDLSKTLQQISKEFDMTVMGKLPFLLGAIDDEQIHGTLYQANQKAYTKSVQKVAKGLIGEFSIDGEPKEKKRTILKFVLGG